jgi:hypothetical protein
VAHVIDSVGLSSAGSEQRPKLSSSDIPTVGTSLPSRIPRIAMGEPCAYGRPPPFPWCLSAVEIACCPLFRARAAGLTATSYTRDGPQFAQRRVDRSHEVSGTSLCPR